MVNRHFGKLAICMAPLSFIPATAFAQATGAAPTDDTGLADIVVTAQRRTEDVQRVPISVSAFSAETLTKLGAATTRDLQFTTPGLVFQNDNAAATPFIRGVGSGFAGVGLEGSIALYVDDVYLQSQIGATQTFVDVSQVQVLKGPQGTLYGRNATGGAIIVTTNDPDTKRVSGYVKGGYGSRNWALAEGMINLPVSDTLAVRVVGNWGQRDGHLINVVDGFKHAGYKQYFIRGKVKWAPTSDFYAVAKVEYQNYDSDYQRRLLVYADNKPTGLGFYQTFQSPVREGGLDYRIWNGSLRLVKQFGDMQLSNVTSYSNLRKPGCADEDYVRGDFVEFCNISERSPVHPAGAHGQQSSTVTNELRLSSSFDTPLNFAAGAFYEHDTSRYTGGLVGSAFGGNSLIFDNFSKLEAWSAYAELYYKFADRFTLTVGGRYNHDKKSHRVENNAALQGAFGVLPSFSHSASFSNFTPRAVLAYDADWANFYASWGRGFKSGGFNTPTFALEDPLRPEKITGIEAGAKFKLLDNRVRLDLAVFRYDWKDLQVPFIPAGTIRQQNAAAARNTGAEINLQVAPAQGLQFQVGATYLHARYRDFAKAASYALIDDPTTPVLDPVFTVVPGGRNLAGFQIPFAPEFQVNGSISYAFNLPHDWSADITVAGRYTTSYDITPGAGGVLGYDRQDGFGIVNITGRIMTPQDRVEIGWFVNNVFNTHFYDTVRTTVSGVQVNAGEPRLYGATVKFQF